MSKTVKLITSIVLCFFTGIIGSLFTSPAIPVWYAALKKPFFSPPNWVFGPVWSVLYLLMGISLFLVWSKKGKSSKKREALIYFGTQLFFNFIWSPIFFGAKNLAFAFIIIVLMWLFIIKTIVSFAKIDKTASYLLYPYIAWVSFASILNFAVWFLNM